jgi:two-component system, OmpR family, sensor histidine kinase CiaH
MFRQTHIRLTLLNSLVFIVLIGTLGSIVYFYTESKLYSDVNRSLMESVDLFHDQPSEFGGNRNQPGPKFKRDPRIMTLFWHDGELLAEQGREFELFQNSIEQIQPKKMNSLQDAEVAGFSYRYIAFNVESDAGTVTVQFIRNVNSEHELLQRLLVIMLIGCGIGILCAVASGYFLAGRALVPIKNAWDKQQEFVSDASHELRTPLAVIQAKTDLLFRNPTATIQEKIHDVSTISKESRRLSKLVTNLLTLARSDSNQLEMKKQEFQLDELLKEILMQFEDIALYQGKEIGLDTPEHIKFYGDKERMHQLIVILLDNALKYTSEGGEIRLSCRGSHSSITFTVKDNGIGIPEQDIPRIFDRFFQSDKARTAAEGTGLGLSIAKWIIDKHHGKIKVNSALGEGTTIEITFPRTQKG